MANEVATGSDLELREKQALQQEETRPGPVFRPDVDILESGDAYVVHADLPGVDERNVQLRLEKGVLSLDAQLSVLPDPSWTPIYTEYRLGGFHREFRLPEEVDEGGVSATMRDGVLELRLPKAEPHQRRQIQVQAG